jgi:hypothetical protein
MARLQARQLKLPVDVAHILVCGGQEIHAADHLYFLDVAITEAEIEPRTGINDFSAKARRRVQEDGRIRANWTGTNTFPVKSLLT